MADFEKVYSVKIDTRDAVSGFQKLETLARSLDVKLKRLNKTSNITAKRFEKLGLHIKESVVGTKSLNANLSRMNRKLRDTTNRSKDMNRAMVKGFSQTEKQVTRLNRKMKKSGFLSGGSSTTFKIAGAAASGFTANAIRSNIKLNESMANVQTLLSGGADQANRLKGEIQSLAIETGKPTADLADGLYEVVSALGESSDNMNQLKVAARAGIGGRSSTIEAVKLLAAVTKGYGDTSEEAQKKAADLSFATVKMGQTTFPELAASIGRVVPLSAALNVSQEDLFATFATATGPLGTASEIATQLSSVYSAFLKPTADLTKLTKKYGFETATSMIKSKGWAETLKILKKETGGEIDAIAKLVTRKEGQLVLTGLLGKQYDTFIEKQEKMTGSTGAADDAFRAQTEGINAQGQAWKKATQQVSVFSQQLGDTLAPALTGVLDTLIPMLETLQGIDQIRANQASESAYLAEQTARTGTTEEKVSSVDELLKKRKKIISQGGGYVETAQTLISKISGSETPAEQRKRVLADIDRAISANMSSANRDIYSGTITGKGMAATTNNNNNVTINVQGTGNPEATAQAVKRQLARELSGKTKTTGNGG